MGGNDHDEPFRVDSGGTTRFAHQKTGTEFIERFWVAEKPGCLIAAEQGTGKTLMVMDFLAAHRDKRALAVVPAIARGEWARQNTLHFEEPLGLVLADTGTKVKTWCENPSGILVTSYNLLNHVTCTFDIVIPDECHMVSNPEAGMTKQLERVCNASENTLLVALSGTPAMDRPDQLWSVLNMCQPGHWGDSIWAFRRRYCEQVPNEWAPSGFVYKGLRSDRAEELRRRLESIMFRVRKQDVGDLPPLLMSLRYVKPKRSKFDWESEDGFSQLLELNSSAKIDACVDVVEQARGSAESKFVVFSYLRDTAEQIGARFRALGYGVEVVTGATPADARHAPIERIRSAKLPSVLVCNIDAVGVSLDFTFAETAVFAEQHWVPGKTSQALGRLVRLSSTRHCNCIFVVVEGSKEQRQAEAFCRKSGDLDRIIAGGRDEQEARVTLTNEISDDDVMKGLL